MPMRNDRARRALALLAPCLGVVLGSADVAAQPAEAEIRQLWLTYLRSKAGQFSRQSGVPSSLWVESEQRRWPVYDLAGYYLPDNAEPGDITVSPAADGEYRIVTRFRAPDDGNALRSRDVIETVFARREGDRWRLANALPRMTSTWRRRQVGPITYVVPPDWAFDSLRARRAAAFVDSLADAFGVQRIERLDYYLTSGMDEVLRVIGLQAGGPTSEPGGLAQPRNGQLFSGTPSVGEEYRHELAHMVLLPLMTPQTLYFVSEGVVTWLGGTSGKDLRSAARELAGFLASNPRVTLDSMLSGGASPAQLYPAAGVLTQMVFERGGVAAVKALIVAGPDVARFRAAVERLLNQPWPALADAWRARVAASARP